MEQTRVSRRPFRNNSVIKTGWVPVFENIRKNCQLNLT